MAPVNYKEKWRKYIIKLNLYLIRIGCVVVLAVAVNGKPTWNRITATHRQLFEPTEQNNKCFCHFFVLQFRLQRITEFLNHNGNIWLPNELVICSCNNDKANWFYIMVSILGLRLKYISRWFSNLHGIPFGPFIWSQVICLTSTMFHKTKWWILFNSMDRPFSV